MDIARVSQFGTKYNLIRFVGAFLVEEQDSLTLIDTNLHSGAKAIIQHIRAQPLPLTRIVLTHAHMDHVGGLDEIAPAFPQAEVLISTREKEIYLLARDGIKAAQMPLHPDEPQTPLKGSFVARKTDITRTFNDGDAIGSLRVIATPGHTPGHVSLLDERAGSVYAGDAMTNLDKLRSSGDYALWNPLGRFVTWHAPTALDSVRRIAAIGPSGVFVAHGKPVTQNTAAILAQTIASGEQRLAKDNARN